MRVEVSTLYILTVSRTLGSYGDEIAKRLSQLLSIPIIDKETTYAEWLPEIADEHGVHMLRSSYAFYHHTYDQDRTYKDYIVEKLKGTLTNGPRIFLGMGSQVIFRNHPSTVHIRINAPFSTRLERLQQEWHLSTAQATLNLEESDTRRKKFIRKVHGQDWEDESLYDLKINTAKINVDEACDMIRTLVTKRDLLCPYNANQLSLFQSEALHNEFRHDVEREFANILDSYGMDWAYEPTTFPLAFDEEGNIIQAISPDFYLEHEDTYIELTVMNPKYMAEKRRKIEKLRELYPEVRVILMDKKGLQSFMERHKLKSHTEETQ